MSSPIPQPPGYPLIGNIGSIDPQNGVRSLMHLAEKYGEIFKLTFFGKDRYFISSVRLLNEVCDEKRFHKVVSGALLQIRNGAHDGLFTAHDGEHAWGVAHRTLIPAFGPIGIQNMYDEMYDVATQLVSKWARNGPDEPINVTDDFTRLTLDSIALCAMDKRFNSFYREQLPPFVGAMVRFLVESGKRVLRTRIDSYLHPEYDRQYQKDIDLMRSVAAEVIAYRRANPSDKKDLLNAMLFGKDPKTGERLTEESVMDNMITFLIAGHETTSGLLSFTTYYLTKNPEALRQAQGEVDQVCGKRPIAYKDISKLPYIEACLREAIRLWPTAAVFALTPRMDMTGPIIIGGQYTIPAGAPIAALLPAIHRDPDVYGADADIFRPERMYGDNFTHLPPNAWKPFGNGARGCIGRPFAWQEAILALAMTLQNFNIRLADPSYELRILQTLTLKPADLFIKASLREGIQPLNFERGLYATPVGQHTQIASHARAESTAASNPMTIFYGSNAGTCEGLANSLASAAASHGYDAKIRPLDDAVRRFPTDHPVVIISASYEGQPPDNAVQFVSWLTAEDTPKMTKARYAVFGCGHRDWAATYQKIPTLIDKTMSELGATQIISRGETDVAQGNIFDDFDEWQDESLWPALSTTDSEDTVETAPLNMEINTSTRSSYLRLNVHDALVVTNELLTQPGAPEKRHVSVKLPTDMTYRAGDYIALLPVNPLETIGRVLRHFSLPWDTTITVRKGSRTTIPIDTPLSLTAILGAYVELGAPASRKNLATIEQYAQASSFKHQQNGNTSDTAPPQSILEILEQNPDINLPFSVYLSMLIPMRMRQYSISSSPLADPTIATITFSVLDNDNDPQHPNPTRPHHLGVATNFLKNIKPAATIHVAVRKSHASFHLPLIDDKTPIIMIAAGTGIAPFRGFVQERAAKIAAGRETPLAPALLFIGSRSPTQDTLYSSSFAEWEALGAVRVFRAFSRQPESSEGCKYAQDRLWAEKELVSELFGKGARAYICGSAKLGEGVADVAAKMHIEYHRKQGEEVEMEEALKWWQGLRGERFAVDVFD